MGYSTKFSGVLKFTEEQAASALFALNTMLGKDVRKLDPEAARAGDMSYVDLRLTKDFSGLEWSHGEKSYSMVEVVNWITSRMRVSWPRFGLTGELVAQGEEPDDRWRLVMVDGRAKRIEWPRVGQRVTCPHCDEEFTIEEMGGEE